MLGIPRQRSFQMDLQLEGMHVLVPGGTRGIGFA